MSGFGGFLFDLLFAGGLLTRWWKNPGACWGALWCGLAGIVLGGYAGWEAMHGPDHASLGFAIGATLAVSAFLASLGTMLGAFIGWVLKLLRGR